MNLIKCILTENRCYKTGQKITPKGVMIHSTGSNNPNLKRYVQPVNSTPDKDKLLNLFGTNKNKNDWNRSNLDVCVHGFIGKLADGSIATAQTLPWNYRGWHCGVAYKGGPSANNTHISFEICEDGLNDANYFKNVYNEAVELTAYLCKEYNLNPLADGVVICHKEGYRRGIASNHGDVEHWFPKFKKTMDNFRNDVYNKIYTNLETPKKEPITNPIKEDDDMVYYKTLNDVPAYYKTAIEKAMKKGALQGTGNNEINVSADLCRTLTILDRLGKLD